MLVLARTGILVPKEDKPRAFITDTPPDKAAGYEVPESIYYLRRVAEGDLLRVEPAKAAKATPAPQAPAASA